MRFEVIELQRRLNITILYVTHDQAEAMSMSDRVVVMNAGDIQQIGTPKEVYQHPQTRFVADFIGESNILEAYVTNAAQNTLILTMDCGQGIARGSGFFDGEPVYVSIRPEKVQLSETRVNGFAIPGVVKEYTYMGQIIKAVVELENGQEFKVNRLAGQYLLPIASPVYVSWNAEDAVVMHANEAGDYQEIEQAGLGVLL
jgi:spermidine/putrescine transport system ATP-binding protein